ncbi:XrtA system polysaccharide deacetylase [Belnapia moabensis]|uniref:XrtA system polysaccharide deacetylase n=1 Tax=Belnapia moabensis TaxID=365533 RepID=UPI0005BA86AA|nr:XrtA system polysaccharide deacetylase [Belnapia moabensis]
MSVTPPRNAMTVDVEDWFQVQNYAGAIGRDSWEGRERRVEANTDRVLELLAAAGVTGTFFTLGWVAERHPALVRRIVAEGHELASHGHGHEQVFAIGPERFRQDLIRARGVLEDAAGVPVHGYRAPTFSLSPSRTAWAYGILAETGHLYSSSVFPGRHMGTGEAEPSPWHPCGGTVLEVPMTVLRAGGRALPVSGGGWFRMTPQAVFTAALRRVNRLGRRGVFYFHPWEIDPQQPRAPGMSWLQRRKHHTGLGSMAERLAGLLDGCQSFAWGRMDEVFAAEIGTAPLAALSKTT